jgi:Flp pilus assembly protein TadG
MTSGTGEGMMRRILKDERGTTVLLTLGFMIFLFALVGFAVDMAYQMTAIGELERSMEAAALAGAGKLGFDDTVFPTARQFAQQYAQLNPHHNAPFGSLINLNQNPGNAPGGHIVLGVWNAGTFTPSVDGTVVNAVRCQFASQIQTSFLRVLGIPTLPVSATAVAVSNPPVAPSTTETCVFPIGVGSCPFQGNTSLGCGAPITFTTSSGQGDAGAGCVSPPCTNTSAWVNLEGGNTNAGYLRNAITAAGTGSCPTSTVQTGAPAETNNGMVQSVMDTLEPIFVSKYNASPVHEVRDPNGNVTYRGRGWKVYVPVIQTACPTGAISGPHTVVGWTELVMAQVINKGECAVNNDWAGNMWTTAGQGNGCTNPSASGATRAIFGYYSCVIIPGNSAPVPGPRSALASRLRLVKMYQ